MKSVTSWAQQYSQGKLHLKKWVFRRLRKTGGGYEVVLVSNEYPNAQLIIGGVFNTNFTHKSINFLNSFCLILPRRIAHLEFPKGQCSDHCSSQHTCRRSERSSSLMASHIISLLTTRNCSSPCTSLMLIRLSKGSPTAHLPFDCGSCVTTYSSTQTSLRSSLLALHLSSGRLLISAKSRSPEAGCTKAEVTRRNDRLAPAIRLSRQGDSLRHVRTLLSC